jgi:hypothetical protein
MTQNQKRVFELSDNTNQREQNAEQNLSDYELEQALENWNIQRQNAQEY